MNLELLSLLSPASDMLPHEPGKIGNVLATGLACCFVDDRVDRCALVWTQQLVSVHFRFMARVVIHVR